MLNFAIDNRFTSAWFAFAAAMLFVIAPASELAAEPAGWVECTDDSECDECEECSYSKCIALDDCGSLEGAPMEPEAWVECWENTDCEQKACERCVEYECVLDEDCAGSGSQGVAECWSDEDCGGCEKCDDYLCIPTAECAGAPVSPAPWECYADFDCDCGVCTDGKCDMDTKGDECSNNEDCGPHAICNFSECGNHCIDYTVKPDIVRCGESGGSWTDCGSGCGPMNCELYYSDAFACPAVCVELCECPESAPIWDPLKGCVSTDGCEDPKLHLEVELCTLSGGDWTECGWGCGPATCETFSGGALMACPEVCVAQCECPSWAPMWDTAKGCIAVDLCPNPVEVAMCDVTGGSFVDCGPCTGPEAACPGQAAFGDEVLLACECLPGCECPAGTYFDDIMGCVEPSPLDCPYSEVVVCIEGGGLWDECAGSSCDTCDDCIAGCVCPQGSSWITGQGCVDTSTIDAEICELGGGLWDDCASSACFDCECIGGCVCPIDFTWIDGIGCVQPLTMPEICELTGGFVDCISPCSDNAPCLAVCMPVCQCPAATPVFHETLGCIPGSLDPGEPTEKPGVANVPGFDKSPGIILGRADQLGGCSAANGRSDGTLFALAIAFFALLASTRRRRLS